MKKALLAGLFFALIDGCFCQTITTLPGWTSSPTNAATVESTQSNTQQTNTIVYQVRKPQENTTDVAGWFNAAIQKDLQKEQWTETIKGANNSANNVQIYATEIKDANAKRWYLLYMGYSTGTRQARLSRIVSSPDKNFFQTYAAEASKHFGRLFIQDSKTSGNTDATATITPVAPPPSTTTVNPPTQRKNFKPVTLADIHSMIMHLEYEAGMGGGIFPVYNAYMLFKDGNIHRYPTLALADLDVAESRIKEPKSWGTWKINGTTINVYFPTDRPIDQHSTWEKKSYYNIRPAAKGETLNGSFKSTTGGGNTALGGDVMVVVATDISFNPQGKFTLAKVAAVSSSRDVWENTNANSNQAGTYTLDGYSITLNYYSGKKQRSFFFFYPDSKDAFGIGQSIYLAKRK